MPDNFHALTVNKTEEDFSVEIKEITFDDLPEGDVTIKVSYSSVNYKDGLASIPKGGIVTNYPFIPGIDLSGVVVDSKDDRFKEGQEVIVTSYELGVSHFGGFSQYARVPGDWIVPLPDGFTVKEAMAVGTAGFTAALSIHKLEANGLTPEQGLVLVTGATGGVGSMAVAMLAKKGYHVIASTGKADEHQYLLDLGAKEILAREELTPEKIRPMDKQRWAAVVDSVGGKTLAYCLSTTQYGGSVAASGLTGGTDLPTTVFPFILRGVSLLGVDSVYCPMDLRLQVWNKIAAEWKPEGLLETIGQEVSIDELPEVLSTILKGQIKGRTIVKL
ncbi:NADPH:quinone oxidoreductase family protein [Bacillus sp. EB01]|uniref:NADPH:quinone oxidoreductase family protein n=1 Tax=Bacillus sp. EB01 TaxID=1347086 RepID=UPI0005C49E4A|nr:acryloyl-CoA reductase [Bacillus sp. EB01]